MSSDATCGIIATIMKILFLFSLCLIWHTHYVTCEEMFSDNYLKSILANQFKERMTSDRRLIANHTILSLCNRETRHWQNIHAKRPVTINEPNTTSSTYIEMKLVGALLSDMNPGSLDIGFMLIADQNAFPGVSKISTEPLNFSSKLYIGQHRLLSVSSGCSLIDQRTVEDLFSIAFTCVLPMTEQLKAVVTLWKNTTKDLTVPVDILLEETLWEIEEWIPLCKKNAHTALSRQLLPTDALNQTNTRFYHTLVGCTKPLANIHLLERQWPGIMRQWVMHHVYLMGLGYVSVYDVDGSAWEYVKEYVGLGLVRYYGSFNWRRTDIKSASIAQLNDQIDYVYRDNALNVAVDNHCMWDSKGSAEWLILLRSPQYFVNDYKIGGSEIWSFLQQQSKDTMLTKMEIVQHGFRMLDVVHKPKPVTHLNLPTDSDTIDHYTPETVFTAFPYIRLQAYPAHYMAIVDPNKVATLIDGQMIDDTKGSDYSTLKVFVREYASLIFNITRQPNTLLLLDPVIADNTMEKLSGLHQFIEPLHQLLIKESQTELGEDLLELLDNVDKPQMTDTSVSEDIRIAFIAPGILRIPPIGYGAIETVIWNYFKVLSNDNFDVLVVNAPNVSFLVQELKAFRPHVIHVHAERWMYLVEEFSAYTELVLVTTHSPYFGNPTVWERTPSANMALFPPVALAARTVPKGNIYFFALNRQHVDMLEVMWQIPTDRIVLMPNGVDVDSFRSLPSSERLFYDTSVSVGVIEKRKGQYLLQSYFNETNGDGLEMAFIGLARCSRFNFSFPSFLGAWTKHQLHENLTNFGNLVHFASDEGAPLVVLEALAAGLGVVTTVNASANLDITKPFITVIPDDKIADKEYVIAAIRKNRELSMTMREEIREYARQTFSWKEVIVPRYATKVKELLNKTHENRFPYDWALRYHRVEQMKSLTVSPKKPYIAVMSIVGKFSNKFVQWMNGLRLIGVDFFLFFLILDDNEALLSVLADYIAAGIVEVQLISQLPLYKARHDEDEHLLHKVSLHMSVANEALAYFRIIGVTWMLIVHEQDYLVETFQYSSITRNCLKYYLKRQEQRQVDFIILHGTAYIKQNRTVPLSHDKYFIGEYFSRSISRVSRVAYYSLSSINCIDLDNCHVVKLGPPLGDVSPLQLVTVDIDYAWALESEGKITSAEPEIDAAVNSLQSVSMELTYLNQVIDVTNRLNSRSICSLSPNITDPHDNLILFVTMFRDIDRGNWTVGQRSKETYYEHFLRMARHIEYPLVVYTDPQTAQHLHDISGGLPAHVIFQDINKIESAYERHLHLHKDIIASESYQNKVPLNRKGLPEHTNGEYTTLMASKMDYVRDAHDKLPGCSYYAFIDFGYIRSINNLPHRIDPSRLLPNRIMFAMLSMPDFNSGVAYSRVEMLTTYEIFAQGGTFIIPNMLVGTFHRLWFEELDRYHKENVVDDEQSLVYQLMMKYPDIFVYVRTFKWFALYSYYLNEHKAIEY